MPRSQDRFQILQRPLVVACLLAAVTLALFAPALRYDFINSDDDLYVYDNSAVRDGLSWSGLKYALTTGDAGTWAPLTWLSYQADSTLFGTRPGPYHLTNVLWHAAAGAILFLALHRMQLSLWVSTLVAGVFLWHPLRSESVVWIAERKDVLCAFFWASGLLAYWFYAQKPGVARWALVFAAFGLGALSKMMMATFPFVLLLLDFWPLKRWAGNQSGSATTPSRLIIEKIPLFLAAGGVVALNARALSSVKTLSPVMNDLPTKLWHVAENYVFYLKKIVWPSPLSLLYPTDAARTGAPVICALLLLAITGFTVWQRRRSPWLLVGWLWFVGTLVPVIGFVTYGHFSVADRYTYLPSIGLTLAAAVGIERLTREFHTARWFGLAIVLTACGTLVRADLPRWRDSIAIHSAALQAGPHHVTYNNRGAALLKTGDARNAMNDFNAAIALKPDYAMALNNRATLWLDLGDTDAAIRDCTEALRHQPDLAEAFNNRGNAFNRSARFEQALNDYSEAIRLKPGLGLYYNNRAAAHLSLQQYLLAEADLRECRRLGVSPHPGLVQAVNDALAKSKR